MFVSKVNLSDKIEINEVKEFLSTFQLKYDENVDYTVVIRVEENIIATVSKEKNIIKCFAVDNKFQGEGISNLLLTNIVNQMFEEGFYHSMAFTKLANKELFCGLGYKEIAHTDKVILMEMGNKNIEKTISNIIKDFSIDTTKKRAMLVMNCNPFTLGHLSLIEKAAAENEEVLIFVVEEDRSVFSFNVRYNLVKKGVSHLKNIKVIPGTEYIISSATFPNYFLRKDDDFLLEYTKLDAAICGTQFARKLNINKRYVGDEPFCSVTNTYNSTLKEILPLYNVELILVHRKEIDNTPISASEVRELLKNDNFEMLKKYVPLSTFEFLTSEEGEKIASKLKTGSLKH